MKSYIAIDLKSFYASVECVEREMDPLGTNLVVADESRTEKTICLAVSPALKAYGIPGRARLFEVVQKVKAVNAQRRRRAPGGVFRGKSCVASELERDPSLELDYVIAKPQMAHYMEVSTQIYNIYLKYIAPEDIHVYSVDEVFIDATGYLKTYGLTARELARKMILDVLKSTGITATAGIGTNLYLSKIAMDIVAKHLEPDENGVRIAELDEMGYKRQLWDHRPLTDFWRLGPGYARKLESAGMHTMGDIALRSEFDEEWFFRTFGVNAGLLLDHAWGVEPCTIADIKAYRPSTNSLSSGQVLQCPYTNEKARLIVWEMTERLALDLLEKRLAGDQVVLDVGYDIDNLTDPDIRQAYSGPVVTDRYGRQTPKPAHGSENLGRHTASAKIMTEAMLSIFDRITEKNLLVRRITVTACHVLPESQISEEPVQLDLFSTTEEQQERLRRQEAELERERRRQQAVLAIQRRYGRNAILRGSNYLEGATARERNGQIGGHKA